MTCPAGFVGVDRSVANGVSNERSARIHGGAPGSAAPAGEPDLGTPERGVPNATGSIAERDGLARHRVVDYRSDGGNPPIGTDRSGVHVRGSTDEGGA